MDVVGSSPSAQRSLLLCLGAPFSRLYHAALSACTHLDQLGAQRVRRALADAVHELFEVGVEVLEHQVQAGLAVLLQVLHAEQPGGGAEQGRHGGGVGGLHGRGWVQGMRFALPISKQRTV